MAPKENFGFNFACSTCHSWGRMSNFLSNKKWLKTALFKSTIALSSWVYFAILIRALTFPNQAKTNLKAEKYRAKLISLWASQPFSSSSSLFSFTRSAHKLHLLNSRMSMLTANLSAENQSLSFLDAPLSLLKCQPVDNRKSLKISSTVRFNTKKLRENMKLSKKQQTDGLRAARDGSEISIR